MNFIEAVEKMLDGYYVYNYNLHGNNKIFYLGDEFYQEIDITKTIKYNPDHRGILSKSWTLGEEDNLDDENELMKGTITESYDTEE